MIATSALCRRFLAFAALLACAGGCAARERTPADGAPARRELRLAFGDVRSLDPLYTDGANGAALDTLAFSYLVRARPDGTLVPDLAAVVPSLANGGIARDGRTLTYRLRRGVRWQDGAPLTSADVAFTIRAERDPRNTIGSRTPYDRIVSLETPDPWTVRVHLRERDASMLGTFLTPDTNAAVLPAHLLARFASLDRAAFNAMPIGSGPYRIVAWKRGDRIRLVANPTYFGGAPRLHALALVNVTDPAVVLAQLETGELDGVIGADARYVDRLRALRGVRVTVVPYVGESVLGFNTESAALANPAMRRALAHLVEPRALARIFRISAGSAAEEARGIFSFADDASAPWPRYDPAAAARTLDALGWRRAASGVRVRAGRELALTLAYDTGLSTSGLAAVAVQQAFARAGVRVSLKAYATSTFYAAGDGPMARGTYDLAFVTYSTSVDPDVTWLFSCGERAPHGYNWSRYCSPRADALMRAALRATDRERRIDALRHLQRVLATDVPLLPLAQRREVDVTPEWLAGFVPDGALAYDSAATWFARK